MSPDLHWTLQEIGRLAFSHRLDPAPLAAALGLDADVAVRLIATGQLPELPTRLSSQTAAWVLNVLVRLEVRCGGDSAAIAAALERPSEALGGQSIADAMRAAPDAARLAEIRAAAGTLPVPKVRMWRVPDLYS